jgi:hypothetical protein
MLTDPLQWAVEWQRYCLQLLMLTQWLMCPAYFLGVAVVLL